MDSLPVLDSVAQDFLVGRRDKIHPALREFLDDELERRNSLWVGRHDTCPRNCHLFDTLEVDDTGHVSSERSPIYLYKLLVRYVLYFSL